MSFSFFLNSILLGVGLAMDAFSVCVANALSNSRLQKSKMLAMASTFAFFQFLMPLIGRLCVKTVVEHFKAFEILIPYIALLLLGFIGGKAVYESLKNKNKEKEAAKNLGVLTLLVQGVATSIDALSVGFTIEQYDFKSAFIAALIIAAVTFLICIGGALLGKKCGDKFSKAELFGGLILIAIGIEIFIKGVFSK